MEDVKLDTWVKAFYIRGSCHLRMNHFQKADKDASKALRVDPENSQSAKLLEDVALRKAVAKKQDKKLARAVAKHVQKTMNSKK